MRILFIVLAAGLVAIGVVFLIGRSGSVPGSDVQAASAPVQRDAGEGGVEIQVTYVTPDYARASGKKEFLQWQPDRFAVFVVAMNTHSVDLSGYDFTRLSELAAGRKTYAPVRWASTSDNTHHRAGALIFPKLDSPLPVELRIKSVAGVPARVFRWVP